mgnify:FL=1
MARRDGQPAVSEVIGDGRQRRKFIVYTMITIAILVGPFVLMGVAAWLVADRADGPVQPMEFLIVVGLLVAGGGAIALILGLMQVIAQIRRLQDRSEAIEHRVSILAEHSLNSRKDQESNGASQVNIARETRDLLAELREILLLSEDERARRYALLREREFKRRLASAAQHVQAHEFHHAREELTKLRDRFGADATLQQAYKDLDDAYEAAMSRDLTTTQANVRELMAAHKWEDAEQAAHELARKYPNGAEAIGLLGLVRRERALFAQKHRQRMHDEIQQFVHQRKWQDALRAARKFIETFPSGQDTELLRDQLATLLENADIQTRRDLELKIKAHIQQKQYWEALDLARAMLRDHPLSPQAKALSTQISRLEDLAQQQQG